MDWKFKIYINLFSDIHRLTKTWTDNEEFAFHQLKQINVGWFKQEVIYTLSVHEYALQVHFDGYKICSETNCIYLDRKVPLGGQILEVRFV